MTRSGVQRRYWSAIRNLHKRLGLANKEGREARKEFFVRTKNKIFKESEFKKNLEKGKTISLLDARKALRIARMQRDKQLKKDYLLSKKSGNKGSFKEFKKANPEPDWEKIQEMFNSPK